LLPDYIPALSISPFIGLAVNVTLALVCLMVCCLFARYKPLSRLFWVYLSVCLFFLGLTGQGYQVSDASILFWYRFQLLGLAWLPFAYLNFLLALSDGRPGPVTWSIGGAALILTGLLVLVNHPAVLALPLEPLDRAGVMRPQSYLVRPIILVLNICAGLALVGLAWSRWPRGVRRPAWAWVFMSGFWLWSLGGIHDVVFSLQLGPSLNQSVFWLASLCLTGCLTLAVALHFRGLDQTLIRQAEELLHARNLATLGIVAAEVAHQVGGFLNKLAFALTVFRAEQLSPDGWETIQTVERSSAQLSDFTRRFLGFARRPELDFQLLSLNEALESALEQCRVQIEAGRAEVVTFLEDDIQVIGDWPLLNQAFVNIITNALESLYGQGRLEVRLKRLDSKWVRIDFGDNGSGMDELTQAEAWEPFISRKEQGIGLGLPLVKNIVEAHGGRVSLTSRPGQGTVVSLTLPAGPEAPDMRAGLRVAGADSHRESQGLAAF